MDKIKFLMSDTGAEITAACREALEQKGVEVTVVEKDGLKVLQKMLAVRPQVVLLDAFMPGLDALAVKQRYNAAGERRAAGRDRRNVDLRAAVEDHAVVAVGRDAAVLAPVNGLVVDRTGDGAVVDDGSGAGLAVVGDTGDDAGIGCLLYTSDAADD